MTRNPQSPRAGGQEGGEREGINLIPNPTISIILGPISRGPGFYDYQFLVFLVHWSTGTAVLASQPASNTVHLSARNVFLFFCSIPFPALSFV